MRLLDRFLRQLQDRQEILPGAAERLRTLSRSQTPGAPRTLAEMATYLAGPGSQWTTREGKAALKSQPTEYFLDRLDCRPGAAKKLFEAWASDVASAAMPTDETDDRSPTELGLSAAANILETRFADFEHRGHLRGESFLSPGAMASRRFLAECQDSGILAAGVDLDALATKWVDLGSCGREEAGRRVALRLTTDPACAPFVPPGGAYTVGQTIEWARDTAPQPSPELIAELGGY